MLQFILTFTMGWTGSMSDYPYNGSEYVATPPLSIVWEVEYDIDPELWCLSEAVYFESKGEPIEGKIAVAQVVINRTKAKGFPNTICGVVYQPSNNPSRPAACQFSFTCGSKELRIKDLTKWDESVNIAANVYYGLLEADIKAKHYVRCGIKRSWMKGMYQSRKVYNHCFWRRNS